VNGPWVGVDPGGSYTGVVVRHGDRLLHHQLVVRTEDEDVIRGVGVGARYLADVLQAIVTARCSVPVDQHQLVQFAVEGVVPPSPHMKLADGRARRTNPGPTIGTGMVLGAILGAWPNAVIVPPNNHGHGMLGSYPEPLVTAAEARRGLRRQAGDSSDIRHCRAAWDCAGRGPIHAALRSSRRSA
jgi:hypothetical protein